MMPAENAVVLINLGTPDSPSVPDVRAYLREFLMDGRVIDIPFWRRFLLVQMIIAPFRAPASSKIYHQLWTERGSPLKFYAEDLTRLLQDKLGDKYFVTYAMRYRKPHMDDVLAKLSRRSWKSVTVIPLYPQYASSTTGSTVERLFRVMRSSEVIPSLRIIQQFCEHPLFLEAFCQRGKEKMDQENYDHILFSYHGIPERHIRKSSFEGYCQLSTKCCSRYHAKNRYCYRAQCFQTSRLLAEKLGISEDQYTVSFQSRLGKTPWIKPYSDVVIERLATEGKKRLLVFSPSFVADCLETTVEIGDEYSELFRSKGGERLELVESLNTHPVWVDCLAALVGEERHPAVSAAQGAG